MEQHWERLTAFAEIETDALSAILAEAIPGAAIKRFDRITSGRANTNYKITLEDGPPVLFRIQTRDPSACAREAALNQLVFDSVPVPRVLYSDPERGFSVWEWVEGTLLDGISRPRAETARDLGRVLAKIGRHQFPAAGFLTADLQIGFQFSEACDGYLQHIRHLHGLDLVQQRLGQELVYKTATFIEENADLLTPYKSSTSLVHADYKGSNILVRDGRVAAVLDWEFAHSGSPLLDIAILFRHRAQWPAEFPDAFAEVFEEEGGFLDKRWQHASRYLDLVSLLDFLSRETLGDRAMSDILGLLGQTISLQVV